MHRNDLVRTMHERHSMSGFTHILEHEIHERRVATVTAVGLLGLIAFIVIAVAVSV